MIKSIESWTNYEMIEKNMKINIALFFSTKSSKSFLCHISPIFRRSLIFWKKAYDKQQLIKLYFVNICEIYYNHYFTATWLKFFLSKKSLFYSLLHYENLWNILQSLFCCNLTKIFLLWHQKVSMCYQGGDKLQKSSLYNSQDRPDT